MKTPAGIASAKRFHALHAWRLGAPLRGRRFAAAASVAIASAAVIAAVTVSIPGSRLDRAADRVDFASKVLTVVGLLAALTWGLFKLVLSPGGLVDEIGETTYSNLKLELAIETAAYHGELRVVTFAVSLENVGKIPIRAGSSGCRLSVHQVPGTLPEGAIVTGEKGETLIDDADLLARYDRTSPYVIGPGVTYRESESIILRGSCLVSAAATFFFADDEDAQTENRLFRVD